jgi:uncharacterized protein with HEPN domain
MSHDYAYLADILIAARDIRTFTAGVSWQGFSSDRLLQAAVQHWIQTIGEAASNVSDTIRDSYPEIAWRSMVGMRHRLVHAYWDIRLSLVWDVVQNDIPTLIETLESVVPPDTPEA